jgi:hypothetical protein
MWRPKLGAAMPIIAGLLLGVALASACRKDVGTNVGTTTAAVPVSAAPALPVAPPPAAPVGAATRVEVQVTEAGFVPDTIPGQVGKPITLVVTRKTDRTCARELVIKGQPGKTELPLDHGVEVTFTPTTAGHLPFGCAMGMMVSGTFDIH